MKYLYYCNSLYQVITALQLHIQRKDYGFENIDNYQADMIVLDAFSGANEVIDAINNEKLFNHIWLVDKKTVKNNTTHLNTLLELLFPKLFINRVGLKEIGNNYDYLTVSKYSKLMSSIWQINKKAKLQLFDEGLATYSLVVALEPHSYIYKHFYKIFNHSRDFYDYENIYINNSKLMIADYKKAVEIKKDPQIIDLIKKIFNKIETNTSDIKRILWFDQVFNSKELNDISKLSLNELKAFSGDTLFLPHPRTTVISDEFETPSGKTLWEISVCHISDIDNKILVTNSSTACLSPKLLFNMEPYIIMTFLLGENENSDHYKFMMKFIDTYQDKSKIMLPKSVKELRECINNSMKSIEQKNL